MTWKNSHPKPIIGLLGGIGSGKSSIARLFAREGCGVINSDQLAHEVLQTPEVKQELRQWLGDAVFSAGGEVDRRALGRRVFADPDALKRLNALIHPRLEAPRQRLMQQMFGDAAIRAIVWDSPLLMETGLDRECDVLVFVKVEADIRLKRLVETRGWGVEEMKKRENLQIPLDKKASVADYYIDNNGDEASSLAQVHRVLSHLFAAHAPTQVRL